MRFNIVLLCFIITSFNCLYSTVITATSADYSDVLVAVRAAVAGDTVQIPSGTSDWGLSTLTVPSGVYLKGAGNTKTKIIRTQSTPNYLIKINGGFGNMISDLTVEGCYNNDEVHTRGIGILDGCIDFKVFDCVFRGFAFSALHISGSNNQRGVIFHNSFIDNYYDQIKNLGYGVVVYGNGVWEENLQLGTENAVYVEDNYFYGNRHAIASNNASKYVFRYNEVVANDFVKSYSQIDAHGLSTSMRGSRSYEIYNNNCTADVSTGLVVTAIGIRGGDGVIFNNTCSNQYTSTIRLVLEGSVCGTYPAQDQIRDLYVWNNDSHDELGYTVNGIDNRCSSSIKEGRDYFLYSKPDYVPYTYPHPLRSGTSDISRSYLLENNGKTLSKWLGAETEIDMDEDYILREVTVIGANAFAQNNTLVSINIGSKVRSIGNTAFQLASSLQKVSMSDSVTTLGSSVFNQCGSLYTVTLSENITKLPRRTFRSCKSLENLNISTSITELGEECFAGCELIKKFDFSQTALSSVGYLAFNACKGLKEVYFPSNLSYIGNGAFRQCYNLQLIKTDALTPPILGSEDSSVNSILIRTDMVFSAGVNQDVCRLIVPPKCVDLYTLMPQWGEFDNIIDSSSLNTSLFDISSNDYGFKLNVRNGVINITDIQTLNEVVEVFDISGLSVYRSANKEVHNIYLKKGVYIVKLAEFKSVIVLN